MNPLRVVMVSARYLPFMGGVENHIYQVSRRLAKRGVDVTVLTTDPQNHWPVAEEVEGFHVRRVRAWPANRDYFFAPGVMDVLQRERWDVVHVQSYHTLVAPMAMAAARGARIPYVVTFHGGGHSSRVRNAARGLQWQLLRPFLARAARLVATARFEIGLYGRALRLPAEQFIYSPNGGDIAADPRLANATPDPSLLISVGRLERYKGHDRVIAALPHVLKQRPDIHLRVLGGGPFEKQLQDLAHKLGVADRVEIRGVPLAERNAMAETLSRGALVALMSEYETHPMAAMEAIALRRSVLVADTSGLSELAENGWARAISLRSSPEQLAAAMLDQLQHPHVPPPITLPTWDDCANDLYQLYNSFIR
ncbi:MAG: glycosyltransferase family 4 protein [Chloroflexi bacterium]|nr:glycosyltransferase family 4 protein [Chloroflexota bacterium]